jgi:site-specific recombinase
MRPSGDKAIADWLIHVCESYLLRNHSQVTGNTTLGLFLGLTVDKMIIKIDFGVFMKK